MNARKVQISDEDRLLISCLYRGGKRQISTNACIGYKSSHRHFLVLNVPSTPIPMIENESNALMEINPRGAVLGSIYVYHLFALYGEVHNKPSSLHPWDVYIFRRIEVFDSFWAIVMGVEAKCCTENGRLPDLHHTLWRESANWTIIDYCVRLAYIIYTPLSVDH